MDDPNPADERRRVRIGDVVFDPASGELLRPAGVDGADEIVARLGPLPSKLLALLAEHPGELVSRETLRDRLWGGVAVDFEQALHFTVRQVRAALGDSARRPRFIENLPRRGYRLLPPVVTLGEAPPVPAAPPPRRGNGKRLAIAAAVLALVVAGILALGHRSASPPAAPAAPSLAVMPLLLPPDVVDGPDTRGLAEALLLRLGALGPDRLAVVGPTTTAAYATDLRAVDRMARALRVDYVLNGRAYADEEGGRTLLLLELIRSTDRAHVWVEAVRPAEPWDPDRMAEAIRAAMGLPE